MCGGGGGGGGGGGRGMQVGRTNEESQDRGCCNITFIDTNQCLYWKRHKQTQHSEHENKSKDHTKAIN